MEKQVPQNYEKVFWNVDQRNLTKCQQKNNFLTLFHHLVGNLFLSHHQIRGETKMLDGDQFQ